MKDNKIFKVAETACIGSFGALLFMLIHMPLPWLLGSLTAVVVWRKLTKRPLYWPTGFRHTAIIFLGAMLGTSFTAGTVKEMALQFPFMASTTMITVLFCLALAFYTVKHIRMDLASSIFGSVPGGMSQVVVMSEETKEVDTTTVVLMQTIRSLSVIFFVPFLTIHGIGGEVRPSAAPEVNAADSGTWMQYAVFAAIALSAAWGGKRIRLPAGFLTGPLIAVALSVSLGLHAPHVPSYLIVIAQVFLGIHIGRQFNPQLEGDMKKLSIYTVVNSLLLVLFSLLLAYLLSRWTPMDFTTAFLSAAPGGIAEMGVTASAVHANLSMVTGYQLFRIFFIMFAVLPLAQWWVRKRKKLTKSA
ncbi:AbrB family transcriptional regulator [Fictibacillus terranigra]|uniref:AbrB family transcriptional regulator n=1 Tax=Fictibacillus terranigra TaxID=3058424 RepID=A0ABT8E2S3_9BACL|nr:AbrB family transcriptional regulator [Fictibacillus sp. CENA-BCM004]MDN4072218.1 AbrB family transcriptional regulator [Fictibacillus sp. CENA-BCM004]